MKKTLLLLSLFVTAFQSHASNLVQVIEDRINFSRNTIVKINDLNLGREVSLVVSYPGKKLSGICGIEIRTDFSGDNSPLHELVSKISIKSQFEIPVVAKVSNGSLIIQLTQDNVYQEEIVLKSKSGKSLTKIIQALFSPERTSLLVIPHLCK